MTDRTGDQPAANRLRELVSSVSSVVAPVTLLTTLLFYFGYASSAARYMYFGLDVDTIGLSTQDFVIRSPGPLLVPLLLIGIGAALVALVHAAVRRHVATVAESPRRLVRLRRLTAGCGATGRAALTVGVAMVFAYASLQEWQEYGIVTPLVLALGAGLTAYGMKLDALLGRRAKPRGAAIMAMYFVLATSIFWGTATLAQLTGRASASDIAAHLDLRPSVILDTKERLYLTSPGVVETVLPAGADQAFHYRYRHLRLLIQGKDRLFLVPSTWSASDSTLVVAMNDGVRIQFQFQP